MADDYLTGVVPALRAAQRVTCQCIEDFAAVVASDRWTGNMAIRYEKSMKNMPSLSSEIVAPRAPVANFKPAPKLSTSAMCLDSLKGAVEAFSLCGHRKSIRLFNTLIQSFAGELATVLAAYPATHSETYGKNDPLTAAWLVSNLQLEAGIRDVLLERVRQALVRLLDPDRSAIPAPNNTAEEHGWVCYTLMRSLEADPSAKTTDLLGKCREWALDQVRQQLSYRATSEPGFDPAHLAGTLAASLVGGRGPLPLFVTGAEAVIESQKADGSWSLNRPFLANSQGTVNLPIAPEMTAQLADLIDALELAFPLNQTAEAVQLRLLDALQHQRDWYFLTGKPTDTRAYVWSSEYAKLSGNEFHVWATARVVRALARLRSVESRLVTSRLVTESGLTARRPAALQMTFEMLIDPETKGDASTKEWLKKNLGKGTTQCKSVLLYGPSGTSKTSMAEAIAIDRDEWLIQISPADFLIEGPNAVESRAKRLFDYLVELEGAVVLFDEIDRLVLDRSSSEYAQQGDVFKFMTPSMLPKLTALWRAPGLRFLIATNYGESIDPAITRAERVDKALLVPPPDLESRKAILTSFIDDDKKPIFTSDSAKSSIAKLTPLWSYGELKYLPHEGWKGEIEKAIPAISLSEYRERLDKRKNWRQSSRLAHEYLVLAEVVHKSGVRLGAADIRSIRVALSRATEEDRKNYRTFSRLVVGKGSGRGGGRRRNGSSRPPGRPQQRPRPDPGTAPQ